MSKSCGLRILSWNVVLFILAAIALSQLWSDQSRKSRRLLSAVEYNRLIEPNILPVKSIKLANLGFNELSADYLWLQTIQYFGGGDFNKRYHALPRLLEAIVELDPHFVYPYIFSMLILPHQGDLDAAIKIGERGFKFNPQKGMIPYYLASLYHINQKLHYERAAYLYSQAARDPEVPKASRVLAGVALSELEEKQAAIAWWQGILEKSKKDSYEHKRAEVWLEHLMIEMNLENLAALYRQQTGRYPADLEELVKTGLIKEIPKSPISENVTYKINPRTGKVGFDR